MIRGIDVILYQKQQTGEDAFGAPVFELGKTLQDVVKSSVESVTGLTVQQVNVNICGVALPREAKK